MKKAIGILLMATPVLAILGAAAYYNPKAFFDWRWRVLCVYFTNRHRLFSYIWR